jgi:hypothetical protein
VVTDGRPMPFALHSSDALQRLVDLHVRLRHAVRRLLLQIAVEEGRQALASALRRPTTERSFSQSFLVCLRHSRQNVERWSSGFFVGGRCEQRNRKKVKEENRETITIMSSHHRSRRLATCNDLKSEHISGRLCAE